LDTLLNIKPTVGILREQVELQSLKMTLWDLSGQKSYREAIIVEEKNLIFEEVDIILFVVDIQDSSRFQEVFEYLDSIIQVLVKFNDQPAPAFIVLLHKADPDFIDTPTFRENYIGLRSVFDVQLEKANLKHDYYITSIYNALPKAQGFRESVKSTVSQLRDMSNSSIPSNVLNAMTNIFDLVVKLSSILEDRVNQLENQFANLETTIQSEFISGVRTIETIEAKLESPELRAKEVLVNELQKLITKKKRKPSGVGLKKIAT
jgi:exonuclease VII small subunit